MHVLAQANSDRDRRAAEEDLQRARQDVFGARGELFEKDARLRLLNHEKEAQKKQHEQEIDDILNESKKNFAELQAEHDADTFYGEGEMETFKEEAAQNEAELRDQVQDLQEEILEHEDEKANIQEKLYNEITYGGRLPLRLKDPHGSIEIDDLVHSHKHELRRVRFQTMQTSDAADLHYQPKFDAAKAELTDVFKDYDVKRQIRFGQNTLEILRETNVMQNNCGRLKNPTKMR